VCPTGRTGERGERREERRPPRPSTPQKRGQSVDEEKGREKGAALIPLSVTVRGKKRGAKTTDGDTGERNGVPKTIVRRNKR